ncbi:MAG: sulfotransferase family protein [Actinomycetota bacterium]
MGSLEPSRVRLAAQRFKYALTLPEKWLYAHGLRSSSRLTLPDFLGIGAMKAGSTWLYEMLRLHPQLLLAEPKEVHYFNRRFHRTLAYYARRFKAGRDRVKGEITPHYAALPPERIRFIGKVMPKLRIVYLIRHPVARAWSQAQREVLRARRRSFESASPAEFYAHFRSSDSRANSNYSENLRRWRAVFPREQIFVGFTDEIKNDPCELLGRIFDHLGASTEVDWNRFPVRQQVNHRGKHAMPEEYRQFLTEMYAPEIERLCEEFGDRIEHWRDASDAGKGGGPHG